MNAYLLEIVAVHPAYAFVVLVLAGAVICGAVAAATGRLT